MASEMKPWAICKAPLRRIRGRRPRNWCWRAWNWCRKNYAAVLQHADAALAIRPDDPNARMFRVIGLTGTHAYGSAKAEAEQLASDYQGRAPGGDATGGYRAGAGALSQKPRSCSASFTRKDRRICSRWPGW